MTATGVRPALSVSFAAALWPGKPALPTPRLAGPSTDGRLFRTRTGGLISGSAHAKVWKEARIYAFTPDQVALPLAGRPYDLRHAAVSLWLKAGVHTPEVAERGSHGVDVMLKVYAKCIDQDSNLRPPDQRSDALFSRRSWLVQHLGGMNERDRTADGGPSGVRVVWPSAAISRRRAG
ncbi:hypothetical protein GCM10018952_13370 [Streptosporangium vulgare]